MVGRVDMRTFSTPHAIISEMFGANTVDGYPQLFRVLPEQPTLRRTPVGPFDFCALKIL